MATITTVYEGNLRTRATHNQSGNTLITDAPTDNHGKGEAFSPTDLFATSLGSCMLTIIGLAANTHGFSIDGTRVETQKIMGTDPRRVAELVVDLYLPANNYTDREKRMIEAAAASCPVAQSLHPETKKTVTFHY
jgi:Predicted redox protein, regulator of disulfide bond formation